MSTGTVGSGTDGTAIDGEPTAGNHAHHTAASARTAAADEARPAFTALIVDDEPDQLSLLTTYFHRAGCSVIAVHDAERALALPADLALDLMVVDLRLPGMDGWQLAELLRERYPRCPIAITSVLDVDDYPDADAVLPKPVTRAHIQNLIATISAARARQ
ncbi:response regulator [Nakamurella sp. GG22]